MSDETRSDFAAFSGVAFLYFGKNINSVPSATLALWTKEVGHYPPEFYRWAIDQIRGMDSGRAVISNFPKAVQKLWGRWLLGNPDKRERSESSGCQNPHCNNGWFWVFEPRTVHRPNGEEQSTITKRLVPCGECRRLGAAMTHGMTRTDAQSAGFSLPGGATEADYLDQRKAEVSSAWELSMSMRSPRFKKEAIQ